MLLKIALHVPSIPLHTGKHKLGEMDKNVGESIRGDDDGGEQAFPRLGELSTLVARMSSGESPSSSPQSGAAVTDTDTKRSHDLEGGCGEVMEVGSSRQEGHMTSADGDTVCDSFNDKKAIAVKGI